jgi:Domain of unknown function (DUF4440)
MRVLFTVCALCMTMFSASAQTASEKTVLDLSNKKFDWLINKQYDSLAIVLDDKLQYIHSNGWIQTKDEVIGDIKSKKLTYQKIEIKESKARLYAGTVIITGTGKFEGTGESPFAIDLCYTEVYVKSGNHWKLASRHANKMP